MSRKLQENSEMACETCRHFFSKGAANAFGPGYASVYDDFTRGLAYETWVDYLEDLAADQGGRLRRVLDLGCGTGSFALAALRRGLEISAVDSSPWMLERFRAKLEKCTGRHRCQVSQATLDQFWFDKPFDAAVCLFDTLNYLIRPVDFRTAIARAGQALRSGGFMLFDLNTEFAYTRNLLEQSIQIQRSHGFHLTSKWQGNYCSIHRLCGVMLSFSEQVSGKNLSEEFYMQRSYTDTYIRGCLAVAGFADIRCFDAFSMDKPADQSERVTYVARKAPTSEWRH